MTDHVISGLVRKRAELAGQIAQLQEDLRHIDGALIVWGYQYADYLEQRRPWYDSWAKFVITFEPPPQIELEPEQQR